MYGGTKTEMERLIKDAAKMKDIQKKLGVTVDANSMSYANIVKAIHVVQEQMYINGTTQKEAEKTITGSLNMVKAAWGNLMPALIQGGDTFDQCVENLVYSIDKFSDNIMPAVESALSGVGTLIDKLVPKFAEKFPEYAERLIPPLIKAAVELAKGLIKALPNIIKTIAVTIVDIFGEQFPIIKKIGDFFKDNAGNIAGAIKKIVPAVLGLVAAFKLFNGIKSITSILGGLKVGKGSSSKGGLFSIFENLAKAKTTTILKGMANLAIILGGVTILTAAFAAVAPHIAKLTDFKSLLEVAGAVTIMGVVGTALAKLGEIAGKIPVATVAKGLANMAIVLAGMSALVLLIGAVSLIDFDYKKMWKITGLIGVLGAVGTALSVFAGIVGMIPIPVVLAGLANIALVLAGVTGIIVAFGALSKIEGFNDFITSGGKTLATIAGIIGEVAGSFVGGLGAGITDGLPKIGENIAEFAKKLEPLFTTIKGVDMAGLGAFFNAIGSFMLKMAGNELASIFTGGTDFEKLGKQLTTFATESEGFFTKVATFPANGFENAKLLFQSLADIGNVPNTGGIGQWFSGKNNFEALAKGLKQLSGEGVVGFFNTVANLPETGFENAKALFKSLGEIGNIPNTGGIGQWFTGENDLAGLGEDLKSFCEDTKDFFAQVNALDVSKLSSLWDSLGKSKDVTANVSKIVDDNINDIVKKISELPVKMGEGLKNSGKSLADALVSVWKDAVKASVAPVNKVLEAANWILKEFGSNKKVISWKPYAKGTNGHKGGNALVNDGRGAEMVQMPNGRTFIPQGRNVFLPNAPKGMKVLPAEKTARLMGRKSPTFRYANGIGDIDLWSYIDNASGLVSRISQNVSYDGLSGFRLNLSKAMVSTVTGEMTAWVDKLFDEAGALSLADYVASKGVEQWRTTVIRALKMEGLYSAANVERTLFQMQTESGGNPRAINLWDSNAKRGIPSKGLMQVIDPTFNSYARAGYDKNIYDPLSNILASVRYATSRYGSLSKAYQGHGYSKGVGTVEMPDRSINLSYTPADTTSSYVNASTVEHNTYSPHFELNISGTSDDRAMARKVKRWIQEALDETFDSFERKDPILREV